MNKFLVSAMTAATLLSATAPVVHAATVSSGFNATVTLSAQCLATTAGTPVIAFGTYIAFGAAVGPVSLSAPLTFKCTSGLPAPTVAFDGGVDGGVGGGVIAGLVYTLTAPTLARTNGTAATATVGAGQDIYSYTFSGSIAAGQPGECISAAATSCAPTVPRTIVVTY